jgi:hypothetical protein
MRIRPNAYTPAVTLLLLLLCTKQLALGQETCPVQYGFSSKPMLFGGLYEAGRCTSFSGCQPRDDFWCVQARSSQTDALAGYHRLPATVCVYTMVAAAAAAAAAAAGRPLAVPVSALLLHASCVHL